MPSKFHFVYCSEKEAKEITNISGVAYSGGPIPQPWSEFPLIIDLAGVTIAPQIPLIYNHENDPEFRLGEIQVKNSGQDLQISGGVDTTTEKGKYIVEAGKKFQWQLSIGARVEKLEYVSADEDREINGRTFTGPFVHIKKSMLREVSVCAIGADPETNMQIAAKLNFSKPHNEGEKNNMNKDLKQYIQLKYRLDAAATDEAIIAFLKEKGKTVEAEEKEFADFGKPAESVADTVKRELAAKMAEESSRQKSIIAACGEEFADFAATAIQAGYTIEETNKIVAALKAQAARYPAGSPNILVKKDSEMNAKTLEAAVALGSGVSESIVTASYAPEVVDAADRIRGISLRELVRLCAVLEGRNVSATFSNETIAAGFSTASLPGILGNVANKKALQAFSAQPIIATRLCRAGDLSDFKESERYRINDVGDLDLVGNGGEIKHGTVNEDKATNKLETYGKIFTLTRQMIINDDLGAFFAIPTAMGAKAARKIDLLFHERLLANPVFQGAALFSANHDNYLTGAASALGIDALKAAYSKFLKAKDSNGVEINITPKYLFVPSELDLFARELVGSAAVVGSTDRPAANVLSHLGLEVVSSPYLNSAKFTGASATGWYLFADPNMADTFEIGYLNGQRTPTVEQGEIDFSTLGISYRCIFDIGIREQAYQGMVFSKGVN